MKCTKCGEDVGANVLEIIECRSTGKHESHNVRNSIHMVYTQEDYARYGKRQLDSEPDVVDSKSVSDE